MLSLNYKNGVVFMSKHIVTYFKDESGAAAAEYALILAIVAVGIAAAVGVLGTAISSSISNAASYITITAAASGS
jgi:pilus assembly protein Flp/PilA